MSLALSRRDGFDPVLAGLTIALVALGAIMVGSSSVGIADERFGEPLHYFEEHLIALGIGLAGLLLAFRIPVDWWHRLGTFWLLAAFALLVCVLVPGVGYTANGATRWIDLGPIRLQASELARPLLLIFMASYSVRQHRALGSSFGGFARPMVLIGLASLLLLAEPDYGATVVLTASCLGILFLAGARLRDVVFAGASAGIALGLLARLSPYRWERILSFLHPWQDQFGSGYQLVNSFIAIGSGTWFGAGLGEGVQKLHYLPEAHTDFVFAVLAEELGFVGASLVVVLFALLVYRAFDIGRRARTAGLNFHGLLAMGIGLSLGLEAAISIGVNTGLLPTKGLALPLISYGRASAVVTLFMLGILFRIGRETEASELSGRGRDE